MVDYAAGLTILSPGSDAVYPSQPVTSGGRLVYTRDGNDTVSLYDPAGNPSLPQSDAVILGVPAQNGEFPGERIPRDWQDTVNLGDWQQPFYVNPQPSDFGINESLYILNFKPQFDSIRLYGSQQDYQLIGIPNVGQALFWLPQGTSADPQGTSANNLSAMQQVASDLSVSPLMTQQLSPQLLNPQSFQQGAAVSLSRISLPQQSAAATTGASNGTPYWLQKQVPDLIGVFLDNSQLESEGFASVPPLSLNSNYFQYLGTTPPPPSTEFGKIKQVGVPFANNVAISPAVSTATDLDSNVYLTSSTTGALGGPNAGLDDIWVTKYDKQGNQLWVKQYGSAGDDIVGRIATDQSGNFYLAGYTTGSLGAPNPNGAQQAFVAKYNSDGDQQWIQQLGSSTLQANFGLSVDNNSNVYVSGIVGLTTKNNGQSVFTEDAYVAKYDTNGNQQYYQQFGSAPPSSQESYGAAVDTQGNLFATGWTSGNIDPSLPGRIGTYDVWISKTDPKGKLQWIKQFGTKDYEFSWGIATDKEGNVYATGWTLGNLGGQNAGSYDAWLAKYDTYGNQLWIKQFGTPGDDEALGITIDQSDDIFLTGFTNGNLGGQNAGSFNAWVARFDTSGDRIWTQQFGSSELDYGTQLTTDNAGHLYVAGLTEGSLGATNSGSVDAWLAKLDVNTGDVLNFQNPGHLINTGDVLSFQADPVPEPSLSPLGSFGLLGIFCYGVVAKKIRRILDKKSARTNTNLNGLKGRYGIEDEGVTRDCFNHFTS